MPKVKTVNVPASPTASVNITHHASNADRGAPDNPTAADAAAGQKIDKVVKIPYRQHTFADGTVGAPNFSPEGLDANSDLGRAANRSHAATVEQLNPYGDPTHIRKARASFPDENPATIGTSQGSRIGFSNVGVGGSVGGIRRKIVGSKGVNHTGADPLASTQGGMRAPRNPVAALKPKPVKAEDQGAF